MFIISGSDIMTASSYLVHSVALSNQSPPGFQLLLVHIARIVIAKVEMCGLGVHGDALLLLGGKGAGAAVPDFVLAIHVLDD